MKVFLDTNVLASAAATRGLCADVLRLVFASHQLFISEQVLKELKRVLRFKFGVSQDLIVDFIWLLQQDTVLTRPAQVPGVELQDKDDLSILAAAIAAGAEVLVTGDKDLLGLGHIEELEILSPRQFWEKLKAQGRARRGKPRRSR
ncbi:MAG TPA: putative toxin-antitoxin system toxin component, PIN family [Thermodesulfobacteriota bacterium]|nr:putative toxin-antitoxin system toxin component, PIN family [Thermodesulfobacteriota bacterium]